MKLQKRLIKLLLVIVAVFSFGMTNVFADGAALTCEDAEVISAIRIFSYAIVIIKTIIPLILLLVTVKNLVNAVLAQDDKAISEQAGKFIKKFILAVCIFFIPTIINVFIGYTGQYDSSEGQYSKCADCLTNMSACDEYMADADITETQFNNMCDSLFGDPEIEGNTAYYLQIVLDVIKYAGIIACIVLSVVDFAKAIIGDDKDMIRPITQKTFTRMIYAVLLFFLPIITEVILSMIGVYGTCSLR